jgi:hypothetical protein
MAVAATTPFSAAAAAPAYVQYAPLVARGLPLPSSLQLLDRFFEALEVTCGLLAARQETCVFAKMRPSVENVCRRYARGAA